MAALMMLPSVQVQVQVRHSQTSIRLDKSTPRNAVRFRFINPKRTTLPTLNAKTDETASYNKRLDRVNHNRRDCNGTNGFPLPFPNGRGNILERMSNVDQSTNIVWHQCSIGKPDRERLLQQKGCVIWITGLSGSGKSTVACALSHRLHARGKLTYVLDGDNVRHGLNKDLSFGPEDRAENIRRVGEVAKLFADGGIICIASLISPYRKDRDSCRALLPKGDFIEVFMDVPLELCEARDPKGLYKLARAGKIKSFTGIDDPYEQPENCEVVLQQKADSEISPCEMAEIVESYLVDHGYLQAE